MTFHLFLWQISHLYDKPNCIWKIICLGGIRAISSHLNLSAIVDRIAPFLKENQQLHDANDTKEVKQMILKDGAY